MAKRKKSAAKREKPELPLFDLPLNPSAEDEAEAPASALPLDTTPESADPPEAGAEARAESPEPAEDEPAPVRQTKLFDADPPETEVEEPNDPDEDAAGGPALFTDRLRSSVADLGVQVLMLAVAILAAYRLGAPLSWSLWPPFAILALVFSFLYWMIPLAFWGQTPGMAWVGHLARSLDDEPLTFHQTFLRWIGALLTTGLVGLPLLLALSKSSLSDRLSQSKTIAI